MTQKLDSFVSSKFKFWSFISMVLLVFLHGYNLQQRYLQPWTTVDESLTFNTFIQYFLCNAIFRFRIPMLFIISGYLYAWHDYKTYKERTLKRLRTLLVPYLLWSAIALTFTYFLENFEFTRELIISSGLMQIDENRFLLHDYKWFEWLGRWIVVPVPYQLWFIRVLIVYSVSYPVIKWLVLHKYAKRIFFSIAVFLWLTTAGFYFIEGEGLLFFSLGVWLQKTNYNISIAKKWMNTKVWLIIFLITSIVKTWLAFNGYAIMKDGLYPLLAILHKLIIFSGLIVAWYGFDFIVRFCMSQKWFVAISSFSFMIYALHVPFITYAINGMFSLLHYCNNYRVITFILLPLIIIAFSILLGFLLRKYLPRLYSLLTGGRGF